MPKYSDRKLVTLEIGRFVAATGVMLFHHTAVVANFRGVTVFGDIFRPGHIGVPYFFVLSGFIIYHVHRADLGKPALLTRFAAKRAIRLFPMFVTVSLLMLLGFILVPTLAGNRQLSLLGVIADLLLLPHADAILSISWTLRHEMVFYAMFSLAILFGPRAFWALAAWIAVSFAGWLYVDAANIDSVPWMGSWSVVATTLNLGFGLGMFVAHIVRKPSALPAWPFVALGSGLLISLYILEWRIGRGVSHSIDVLGTYGALGYLVAASFIICGLVRSEEQVHISAPKFWKIAGSSSYLLYLIHQPLASVTMRLLEPFPVSAECCFLMISVTAIVTAVVLHLTIEQWILAKLSQMVKARAGD